MKHDGDTVRWRPRASYANPADAYVYSNRVSLFPHSSGRTVAPRRRMALRLRHRAGLLRRCKNPVPRRPRSLVCRTADQACHLMTSDPFQISNSAYGTKRSVVPTSAANSNSPWTASGPRASRKTPSSAANLGCHRTRRSKADLFPQSGFLLSAANPAAPFSVTRGV